MKEILQKNIALKKILIGVLLLVLILVVAFPAVYRFGQKSKVYDEAVAVAAEQLKLTDAEYNEKVSELNKINAKLKENEATLKEMETYQSNKEELDREISKKALDLSELKSKITLKEGELNKLTNEVSKAKSAPKKLSAGVYIVGRDIDSGTYDIVWASGSGNFFLHGAKSINEIFGSGEYRIKEYKNASLSAGDEIQIKGGLSVNFYKHQ